MRFFNKKVWVDGNGRELDVEEMADDYIMNCLALLQRRKNELSDVEWDFKAINKEITRCDKAIAMFADEMLRREDLGITIER